MNDLEFQIQLQKSLLGNFDSDLQEFYHEVICRELGNLSANGKVTRVRKALRRVVHAYKKGTVEKNTSSIIFDTPEMRCAYVLKHSVCFGSAVAKHFLRLLRSNPLSGMELAVQRRIINLCCLGGGPGTEAVAIAKVVSALDACEFSSWRKNKWRRERLQLNVSVVDLSGDWRTTAELVFRTLNSTQKVFDPEWTAVDFQLLEADLTMEEWNESIKSVISQADIITMVYFISAVNGSPAQKRCVSMLENVLDVAKPESLLFFLDSAKELHYEAVHFAICQNRNMRPLYGPFVQEFHTLSNASIRKFIELYFDSFNAILCLTDCFITSAGWTKLGAVIVSPRDGNIGDNNRRQLHFRISSRKWNKRVKFNTRKQEMFQQQLEKLLLSELKLDFMIDDLFDRHAFGELSDSCLPCRLEPFYATKSKQKRIFAS